MPYPRRSAFVHLDVCHHGLDEQGNRAHIHMASFVKISPSLSSTILLPEVHPSLQSASLLRPQLPADGTNLAKLPNSCESTHLGTTQASKAGLYMYGANQLVLLIRSPSFPPTPTPLFPSLFYPYRFSFIIPLHVFRDFCPIRLPEFAADNVSYDTPFPLLRRPRLQRLLHHQSDLSRLSAL